jgi:pyruvate kinase
MHGNGDDEAAFTALVDELREIRAGLLAAETAFAYDRLDVHESFVHSVRNLLHYLALRRRDARELQARLAALRLSSLGRSEVEVLESIETLIWVLTRLAGAEADRPASGFDGGELLGAHTRALLGPREGSRRVAIMVTLPSQAADDPALVESLVRHGTDAVRINTAHDEPAGWRRMVTNVRRAERELGRTCSVLVDLAGPKLRTGPGFTTKEGAIRLLPGDRLVLVRDVERARLAEKSKDGTVIRPAAIGCTLAEVFDRAQAGHPVWLDDGKIGGVIESATPDEVELVVTHTRAKGGRLRSEKGINLPETDLAIPALTAADLESLPVVAELADMVGLSFIEREEDVRDVQDRLLAEGRGDAGIVLKIETRRSFERLPQLLLAAMRSPAVGVMIARGDLAVECGWERLAEVQEEILWLCEAAHVPVIWATEVLDTLAKTGLPSRAEITDAAMAERAECVMLNKGPKILDAVVALDDILRRMQEHQEKKRSLLRELRAWREFDPAAMAPNAAG